MSDHVSGIQMSLYCLVNLYCTIHTITPHPHSRIGREGLLNAEARIHVRRCCG